MKRFTALTFALLLFVSCEDNNPYTRSLLFKNKSSDRVYFYFSSDYSNHHYPDVTLPEDLPQIGQLAPNGGSGAFEESTNWKKIYSQLPDQKFSVYYFDELPQDEAEWDDIKVNHLVLRKDVLLEDLKTNDFTIYYP